MPQPISDQDYPPLVPVAAKSSRIAAAVAADDGALEDTPVDRPPSAKAAAVFKAATEARARLDALALRVDLDSKEFAASSSSGGSSIGLGSLDVPPSPSRATPHSDDDPTAALQQLKAENDILKKKIADVEQAAAGREAECTRLQHRVQELAHDARQAAALHMAVRDGAEDCAGLRQQLQQCKSLNDTLSVEVASLRSQLAAAAAAAADVGCPQLRIVSVHGLTRLSADDMKSGDVLFAM